MSKKCDNQAKQEDCVSHVCGYQASSDVSRQPYVGLTPSVDTDDKRTSNSTSALAPSTNQPANCINCSSNNNNRSAAAITAAAEVSDNRQESLIKEMTFASTALGSPEMRTLAAVNAVSKRHQSNAAATTKRTRHADDDDDASYCVRVPRKRIRLKQLGRRRDTAVEGVWEKQK
ncbi:unnamed protein product [Ceratitis capitata]|uniref:(Mediterranean fruit fly) hypothetical protein n=1 Tax=Ceratitis capitata TaxID=7213 RepID=A0A811UH28_CERCA|nr:unnamed protein product [Ceratitis capitata]